MAEADAAAMAEAGAAAAALAAGETEGESEEPRELAEGAGAAGAAKRKRLSEAPDGEDDAKRARAEEEGGAGRTEAADGERPAELAPPSSTATSSSSTFLSTVSSRSVSPVGDGVSRTEGQFPGKTDRKPGRKPPNKIVTTLPTREGSAPAPATGEGPMAAAAGKGVPEDAPQSSSSSSSVGVAAAEPSPAQSGGASSKSTNLSTGESSPKTKYRVKLHRHLGNAVRGDEQAAEGEGFESIRTGTVRRIMRVDSQLKPIQAEAVPLLGKACELFIHHFLGQAVGWVAKENRSTVTYTDLQRLSALDTPLCFLQPLLPSLDKIREDFIAHSAQVSEVLPAVPGAAADLSGMGRAAQARSNSG